MPHRLTWDVALSVSFVYLFSLLVLVGCVNSTNTYINVVIVVCKSNTASVMVVIAISVVSFDINGSLICDNGDADGVDDDDDSDDDDDDDEEKHGANIGV